MRLPWECHNQPQDTNWRHCVTGPELPFFHKRNGILKIDQSVKCPDLGLVWELQAPAHRLLILWQLTTRTELMIQSWKIALSPQISVSLRQHAQLWNILVLQCRTHVYIPQGTNNWYILIYLRSRYENATPNLCWVFCALLGVLCNSYCLLYTSPSPRDA